MSIGPTALDRRTDTVRSSVRSHHFSGSQHAIPRRQDCRLFAAQEPADDFGLVSATSVAACARCGWHVGASGRNERLWTDPNWRSSPAGPGRSAAPTTHGWHDHTFHAPSQPGGLMCARDEDEAQATSPGPGRLVRAPSRAARSAGSGSRRSASQRACVLCAVCSVLCAVCCLLAAGY